MTPSYADLDKSLDYLIEQGFKIDKGQFEIGDQLIFGDVHYHPGRRCWWIGKRQGSYEEQKSGSVRQFLKFLEEQK